MPHVLLRVLFLVASSSVDKIVAFDLPNECNSWSAIPRQQCCSCSTSSEIVCTHVCPKGYYKMGSFLITDGEPSVCLLNLASERLPPSSNDQKGENTQNEKALLCGRCSQSCNRCNGPTDQHCLECSLHSYKDVVDQPLDLSSSASGEIIAASLLLPDGNLIEYKSPSVRNLRRKRAPKLPPIQQKLIGKSVRFNSSEGISGYISWIISSNSARKSRTLRRKTGNVRSRRRIYSKIKSTNSEGMESEPSTTRSIARNRPSSSFMVVPTDDETGSSKEGISIDPSTTFKSTTVSFVQSSTPATSEVTTVSLTSKTTAVKRTENDIHTSAPENKNTTVTSTISPETEKSTTKQKATKRPTTEATPLNDVPIFNAFNKSKERKKTWFRCVQTCPAGKYIVRETKCRECPNSQCPGARECFVINVHNVCVQTCQPGFVKHIGLMECLCPGPVVDQKCTQPVHVRHPENLSSEFNSAITNLTIVIPVLICFLTICAMLMFICRKRNRRDDSTQKKANGVFSSVFTTGIAFDKCYRKSKDPGIRDKLTPSMSHELMTANGNLEEEKRDIAKEDSLGRIMWKFDDYPTRPLPQLSTYNMSDPAAAIPQNKRWKIPIIWQVSTPPSIPKKKTPNYGALSKVQAFLSKYTPDLYGNREISSIYKAPPPTPKMCRPEFQETKQDYGAKNYGARPQLIPVEVIQSWLHSSFDVDRSSSIRICPSSQSARAKNESDAPDGNNSAESDAKPKRKMSRPTSNCYESIDGSNDMNEAIYESLSENESEENTRSDAYSYASVHSKKDSRSLSKPVYANVSNTTLYDNSGVSC